MILTVRDLQIAFSDRDLFHKVNLDAADGEVVAIRSHIGDGATTLLRSFSGLIPEARGKVLFDGVDVIEAVLKRRFLDARATIGFVPQHRGLISIQTVFRNMALPARYHSGVHIGEIKERVMAAAVALRITPIIDLEPNELNDAQTRIACLGRALVTQPRLLLTDKLEGGLSGRRHHELIDVIRRYQAKLGFASIHTTLMDDTTWADKVYRIEDRTLVRER